MIWKINFPSHETITLPSPPSNFSSLSKFIDSKSPSNKTSFCLKYLDSENELINLTNQEDFETAILSNNQENLKTMNIFITPPSTPSSSNQTPEKGYKQLLMNTQSTSDKSSLKKASQSKALISHEPRLMQRGRDVGTVFSNKPVKTSSAPHERKDHFSLNTTEDLDRRPAIRREKRQKSATFKGDHLEALKKLTDERIAQKIETEMAGALPALFKTLRDLYGIQTPKVDTRMPPLSSYRLPQNTVCYKCKKPCQEVKCVCKECCSGSGNEAEEPEKRAKSHGNDEKLSSGSPQVARRQKTMGTEVQPRITRKESRFSTYPLYLSLRRNPAKRETNHYKVSLLPSSPDKIHEMKAGEKYRVGFQLKNCGDEKWPENTRLVCINGLNKGNEKLLPSLEPGRQISIELSLHAPKEAGKYLSQWRVSYGRANNMRSFGESLFEEILVKDSPTNGGADFITKVSPRNRAFSDWSEGQAPEEGRQDQIEDKEHKKVTPKKNSLLPNGHSVEKGVPIALFCKEDRLKCAEYLNEILPGELEEKKKFVNTLPENCSIFDVVEKYLVKLGGQHKNLLSFESY